jgi:predicted esterase
MFPAAMPPVRAWLTLNLCLMAALPPGVRAALPPAPTPGAIVDAIVCTDDPTQSYALYLPSNYTAERAWPIVYCFDPAARGRRPVERFRAAAELYGYIIVGSNNSRNNLREGIATVVNALLRDTYRRFRLDAHRKYAAGFSGGARVACAVGTSVDFAGIIASGAGFSDKVVPAKLAPAFFGSAGREDFNYSELKQIDAALAAQHARHRLVIFEGSHEWLPEPQATEALGWMELQAMRSGLRPKDEALVGTLLRQRLQAAAVLKNPGEAYEGYLAISADFDGLTDVSEPAGKAATLKDTKPVRQYFKDEKRAEQQEQRWRENLYGAIAASKNWTPFQSQRDAASPRRRLPAADDSLGGASMEEWAPANSDRAEDTDRYAVLRDIVREVTRESKTNVAARRALSGAFGSSSEQGRYLMDDKNYAAAAECFEAAAIIRPESPASYVELTRAYALLGNKPKARECLQNAIVNGLNDPERIKPLQALVAP